MGSKFFLVLLHIFILPLIVRCQSPSCDGAKDWNQRTKITCFNIGDDGRSLDDVLLQTTLANRFTTPAFDQLAPTIFSVSIWTTKDLVLNDTGVLARLTQLEDLRVATYKKNIRLTVPRQGLARMPKLQSLELKGLTLAESTIDALENLKDQVNGLKIENCLPGKKILKEVAKFTNLTSLFLDDLCEDEALPEATFENSASKLQNLVVRVCSRKNNVLTKKTFNGMSNLEELVWQSSNITTIESGAFDNLAKLKVLTLNENKIKNLPPDLFDNNSKLTEVNMRGNGVENLTRGNFTHCSNFDSLLL